MLSYLILGMMGLIRILKLQYISKIVVAKKNKCLENDIDMMPNLIVMKPEVRKNAFVLTVCGDL